MVNSELEQRVNVLEQQVAALTDALRAVTQLSTTPPERAIKVEQPMLYGTANVAEALRTAGLMAENRLSSEEKLWRRLERSERSS